MKIGAIICEVNPPHSGHKYIFETAKKDCDILISVMSGNYVQRGECAVLNKYKRAEKTLEMGADIAVELPFPFSSSSAEFFAKSGVYIAEKMGAEALYFGSECADKNAIIEAARLLNLPEYIDELKEGRAAEKRETFLRERCPEIPESILSSPNDILGVEYARFADISLNPIKRIDCKSASEIRLEMYNNNTAEAEYSKLSELIFNHFMSDFSDENHDDGIINRAIKIARETNNHEDFLEEMNTKQYTRSRIKRTLLFDLLGATESDLREMPRFTNILAVNEKGKDYIASMRKKENGPSLLTSASDGKKLSGVGRRQFELSLRADRIYTYLAGYMDPAYFIKKHTIIL